FSQFTKAFGNAFQDLMSQLTAKKILNRVPEKGFRFEFGDHDAPPIMTLSPRLRSKTLAFRCSRLSRRTKQRYQAARAKLSNGSRANSRGTHTSAASRHASRHLEFPSPCVIDATKSAHPGRSPHRTARVIAAPLSSSRFQLLAHHPRRCRSDRTTPQHLR